MCAPHDPSGGASRSTTTNNPNRKLNARHSSCQLSTKTQRRCRHSRGRGKEPKLRANEVYTAPLLSVFVYHGQGRVHAFPAPLACVVTSSPIAEPCPYPFPLPRSCSRTAPFFFFDAALPRGVCFGCRLPLATPAPTLPPHAHPTPTSFECGHCCTSTSPVARPVPPPPLPSPSRRIFVSASSLLVFAERGGRREARRTPGAKMLPSPRRLAASPPPTQLQTKEKKEGHRAAPVCLRSSAACDRAVAVRERKLRWHARVRAYTHTHDCHRRCHHATRCAGCPPRTP